MKLAVLSDIHGNLPALEAVVADAGARGCDAFVNLGDSLSGPLWPRETADRLMALGWPTLAGNHERQLLTMPHERMNASDAFTIAQLDGGHLEWLRSQPPTIAWSDDLFLCHGTPDSDITYFLEDIGEGEVYPASLDAVRRRLGDRTERTILCGHTHIPRVLWLDGRTIANPGSVGLPAYSDDLPCPHVMEAGTPHARYAIVEDGGIDLVDVLYDFAAAAEKARAEGRRDWAFALRTGRAQ